MSIYLVGAVWNYTGTMQSPSAIKRTQAASQAVDVATLAAGLLSQSL